MAGRIVFDIESDGLLSGVQNMWVMCTYDLDTKEERDFLAGDDSWKEYLHNARALIGHNIINYDLNVLKKLFDWDPNPTTAILDTLLFSQMLNFRRFGMKGHSLATWGEALKYPKIEFDDWSQYSEEMRVYCKQDVSLNVKVYKYLAKEFNTQCEKNPLIKPSLRNEHSAAKFMAEAERIGWLFDKDKAVEVLARMRADIDVMTARIEPLLGMKAVIVDRVTAEENTDEDGNPQSEVKWPKYTKKGFYHYHTAKWFDMNPEIGLYDFRIIDGPYCRVTFEDCKLTSVTDVKKWLYRIGWEPDDWNFKRDPETRKNVKTSAKISDSSLELLGELGLLYSEFLTTNSRYNLLKGWIASCDENNRVHGGAMVFGTPTGRCTHKNIANIPSVGNPWGADIRSLFMTDPGTVIIGCDSSGNQMRAFCHHLGNDEFTTQVLHGDVHQANADILTKVMKALGYDIVVSRKQAKTFIYAFLFGVGAEKAALYITGKRDASLGTKIKDGFAVNVVGLDDLNKMLERAFSSTKKQTGFGYISAVDGSRIYSDSLHKVLNYLLQRFESVTVKSAMRYMMNKLKEENIWWQPLIMYHDEVQFMVKDEPEVIEKARAIAKEAFSKAAEEFNVFITDGEAKVGRNWAETH